MEFIVLIYLCIKEILWYFEKKNIKARIEKIEAGKQPQRQEESKPPLYKPHIEKVLKRNRNPYEADNF